MTTAVVVGGASGIGSAVAARHRERGDDLVVWDVAGIADVVCDITDSDQVDAAIRATVDRIGAPDLVSVTAGIGYSGALMDAPASHWDHVLATNARGPWLAMRGLARPMLDNGGGSIVATSSISGQLADKTMGLYCASKAALDMIVAVAAVEWAPTIRVNAVAPGVTDTPMLGRAPRDRGWLVTTAGRTALGRIGSPEDVADTILAVHSLAWVTGQTITSDGGLSRWSPIDPLGGC